MGQAHSSLESLLSRPPLKKAVVIGINYSGRGADEEFTPLHGCSRGAREFKDFLIDVCGFESENVILMVDDEGHPLQSQPKERNILRELKNLVRGALPDDILVLYYAGHGTQLPCKDHTESDGFDEVIVAADCDGTGKHCGHGLIKDNVLRKILVVPLLEGVCFRAFFDACHSGTLMDLDHYHCNRRQIDAQCPPRKWSSYLTLEADVAHAQGKLDEERAHTDVGITKKRKSKPSLTRSHCRPRSSSSALRSIVSTACDVAGNSLGRPSLDAILDNIPHGSFQDAVQEFSEQFLRCSSPEQIPLSIKQPLMCPCDGHCAPCNTGGKDIISLSVCADSELCVEFAKGDTMTQILIQYLRANPRASMADVMIHMCERHDTKIHKLRQRCRKAAGSGNPLRPLPNYQKPQLGSMMPLDMSKSFIPVAHI